MTPPASPRRHGPFGLLSVCLTFAAVGLAHTSVRAGSVSEQAFPIATKQAPSDVSLGTEIGIRGPAPSPSGRPLDLSITNNGGGIRDQVVTVESEPLPLLVSSVFGMMVWGGRLLGRIRRGG